MAPSAVNMSLCSGETKSRNIDSSEWNASSVTWSSYSAEVPLPLESFWSNWKLATLSLHSDFYNIERLSELCFTICNSDSSCISRFHMLWSVVGLSRDLCVFVAGVPGICWWSRTDYERPRGRSFMGSGMVPGTHRTVPYHKPM